MSDTKELIVTFKRGISEDIARAAVKGAGGSVRRRMRSDNPSDLLLLVKVEHGTLEDLDKKMKAYPTVLTTEVNQGGFGVR